MGGRSYNKLRCIYSSIWARNCTHPPRLWLVEEELFHWTRQPCGSYHCPRSLGWKNHSEWIWQPVNFGSSHLSSFRLWQIHTGQWQQLSASSKYPFSQIRIHREGPSEASGEGCIYHSHQAPTPKGRCIAQRKVGESCKGWQYSAPAMGSDFNWIRLWSNLCPRVLSKTTEQSTSN